MVTTLTNNLKVGGNQIAVNLPIIVRNVANLSDARLKESRRIWGTTRTLPR